MNTLTPKTTEKSLQQLLSEIKNLALEFRKNIEQIAKRVKAALEIDREKTFQELKSEFPKSMLLGFERVADKRDHPLVFLNGCEAAIPAQTLVFRDQKRLVEQKSYCIVGGRRDKPEWRHMSFNEMSKRSAEALINPAKGVLRKDRKEIANAYFKRSVRITNDSYSLSRDREKITFHRRTWKIAEVKALLQSL